jgi:integrase
MPTLKLTKRIIDQIPFTESGQCFYRDVELTGFGVCVGTTAKTFFVEARLHQKNIRQTLGRYPLIGLDEARSVGMQRLSALMRGENPVQTAKLKRAKEMTVEQGFAAVFEAKRNLVAVTKTGYARTLRLYLPEWRKLPLREITREMVLAKFRKISAEHGAITANNAFRHLRAIYNFVSSVHDEFPVNPVSVLSRTRSWAPERRRRTLVAPHQLPNWWQAVMSERPDARDFILVALFSGMRRNEIAKLKWEYLDFSARTLEIPLTKNGDPLLLPLSNFLLELFSRRREIAGQSEWVFPGNGASGHIVETKSFLSRIVGVSEVKFTLHDLRRTYISIAESLDISSYALKKLLNHRSNDDMTGSYIIVSVDRLRLPVERIATKILELVHEEKSKIAA